MTFTLPTHPTVTDPLTGEALRALAVLPSGRVVWPVMGADDSGGDSGETGAATGTDPGTAAGATATPGATGDTAPAGGPGGNKGAAEPDPTVAEIVALAKELGITPGQLKGRLDASRKWEARAKENSTAAEQLQAMQDSVKQALGLKDDPPDPAALQTQLKQQTDLMWEMRLETAAERAARRAGGDPDLVVPVVFHSGALDALDPTADDFDDKVDAAVKTAIEKNPRLRAAAELPQGNRGPSGGAATDPNAWLRRAAGRA